MHVYIEREKKRGKERENEREREKQKEREREWARERERERETMSGCILYWAQNTKPSNKSGISDSISYLQFSYRNYIFYQRIMFLYQKYVAYSITISFRIYRSFTQCASLVYYVSTNALKRYEPLLHSSLYDNPCSVFGKIMIEKCIGKVHLYTD